MKWKSTSARSKEVFNFRMTAVEMPFCTPLSTTSILTIGIWSCPRTPMGRRKSRSSLLILSRGNLFLSMQRMTSSWKNSRMRSYTLCTKSRNTTMRCHYFLMSSPCPVTTIYRHCFEYRTFSQMFTIKMKIVNFREILKNSAPYRIRTRNLLKVQ